MLGVVIRRRIAASDCTLYLHETSDAWIDVAEFTPFLRSAPAGAETIDRALASTRMVGRLAPVGF